MSEQIYIFNPEHDLCIANGDENFVPPRSAVGFAKENMDLSEHLKRPNKQRRQIIPWGWNHSLKKRLINEGIDPATLPSEDELQFIRTHSRREFALDVHSRLKCMDPVVVGPDYRIVATSVREIETYIEANGNAVLKSPLSGSGKGIRFVREKLSESDEGWCKRTLDKQGSVIVERRFDIIKECAMLFECHHEGIDFIGYSLFESKNGAYSRNILASNEDIEDIIAGYIPRETLIAIREDLTSILADTLVGHYEGFLGVDQIICQTSSPVFIPVSEINLRMTMGLIARNLHNCDPKRLEIRQATHQDLDTLMEMFEGAKQIMRSCGNLNQWNNGYPSADIVRTDIESGYCYVACEDGKILATMSLIPGPDPTYTHINGKWPNEDPYYVIHRIATNTHGRKLACKMFDWAFDHIYSKGVHSIRIDTHKDNCIMKHILAKYGFRECGVIYLGNGDPRDAYHKDKL